MHFLLTAFGEEEFSDWKLWGLSTPESAGLWDTVFIGDASSKGKSEKRSSNKSIIVDQISVSVLNNKALLI